VADLGFKTALSQIEVALQRTILLAYGARTTHADAAALRAALTSTKIHHNQIAYVTSLGLAFYFDRFSTSTDDGTTVIRPSDNPSAGRWLVSTSAVTSGYLKAVKLYEGEVSEDQMLAWLFGQVPSAIIVWEGDRYEVKSVVAGALYRYVPEFSIWACSRNLRGEKQGALGAYASGPLVASEQTTDPGVNRIIGDLRYALAGSALGQDGVDWVEIVSADRVLSSATTERGHVYRLRVRVYATLHNAEESAAGSLDYINVNWEHANQFGGPGGISYDGTPADPPEALDTYITAPAYLSMSINGLVGNVTGGPIVIGGVTVTAAAITNYAQPVQTVSYRYVSEDGEWTQIETNPGDPVPATPTGYVLVGVSESDLERITIDRVVAPWLYPMPLIDQVELI